MSTTLASSPWTAARGPRGAGAWNPASAAAAAQDGVASPVLQWRFVRCASFASCHLVAVFALLGVVSLAFGVAFWHAGAPGVLPFAGVEVLLVGVAFTMAARHAGDGETITLSDHVLRVEHRCGRRIESATIRAEWVRVEPLHGEGSLVELSGQGRQMRVGRYLRPHQRAVLARDLRAALRRGAGREIETGPNRQPGRE